MSNITFNQILDRASTGSAPNRRECQFLLELPETAHEAGRLRALADHLSRQKFNNTAILLGQIGIESTPCPGDCGFCAFSQSHMLQPAEHFSHEDILAQAESLTAGQDLYALFLMTMHCFDFDSLLQTVTLVRDAIPAHTRLVVNIGDFDRAQAETLRASGVSGAYHVRRLREGIDTSLDPEDRLSTIEAVRESGMDWYTCCEPVGPEHSPQELADQLLEGVRLGCFQHAAMRRVPVPGTPLEHKGQISNLRLAQIVAVVTLANLNNPALETIAVHEPNLLGLTAGANTIYAEAGVNPRDRAARTEANRGMDTGKCRQMLFDAGFSHLLRGDGSKVELRP